ncbi:MAG: hypothetical protein ATN35_01590 [Epulopiscium sp. Nele67-Bin004]|nr:MAG: hypothetical protein ATN35_01590 [Epulopiscium sp. Nele67-Bin004]
MQYNDYMSKMSVNDKEYSFYDVKKFIQEQGGDFEKTPYSIRVLLENIIRNGEEVDFPFAYAKTIAQAYGKGDSVSVPYKPTRVILQDLTGVPAVVDLASLREGMKDAHKNPKKITPEIQVDLVIDHSVQMD